MTISMSRYVPVTLLFAALAFLVTVQAADPQDAAPPKEKPLPVEKSEAALDQERLALQFRDFEAALLRLAQRLERSSKAEDRDRAVTLKAAIKKASETGIDARFETLVHLLRNSKTIDFAEMKEAMEQSKALANDIKDLLDLLTNDNDTARRKAEQERLKKLLGDLEKVIREQKIVRAQTEGRQTEKGTLGKAQEKVTKSTQNLAKAMNGKDSKEGKTNDSKNGAKEGKNNDSKEGKAKGDEKGKDGTKDGKGDEKGKDGQGKEKDGQSKIKESKSKDQEKGKGQNQGDSKDGQKNKDGKSDGQEKGQQKNGNNQKSSNKSQQGQKSQEKGQQQNGNQQQQQQQQQSDKNDQQLPGQKRVQDALQDQQNAEKNIDKQKNEDASKNQDDAIKKLEEVRKQWEALLRQLREEEMRRLLEALQNRCQRMLAVQMEVYEGTLRVDKAIADNPDKKASRAEEQRSLQLSDREQEIVRDAVVAIRLLETEGSAVAFPEVFAQVRDDALQVVRRLGKADVGVVTQATEQDIIAALKEMIEALERAKQDLQNQQQNRQQQQQQQQQQQNNRPLIDRIAELKMIRSMQIRVNNRTLTYGRQYPGEQARDPDIQKELGELAQRQQKIFGITNNIAREKNK